MYKTTIEISLRKKRTLHEKKLPNTGKKREKIYPNFTKKFYEFQYKSQFLRLITHIGCQWAFSFVIFCYFCLYLNDD